jgi:hypothetical protein
MMEFAEFQKLSMLWVDDLDQEDISGGLPLSPALLNQVSIPIYFHLSDCSSRIT